jgi:hypothetical protein
VEPLPRARSALERELLKAKGIETVASTFLDFAKAAQLVLNDAQVDSDQLKRLEASVPSDLIPAFTQNAAATARLLSSWVYVIQASFSEKPNVGPFLKGDRANWALIANGDYFERDLEAEVYEDLLDYATSSGTKPSVGIILGPAGYGITTLLMAAAVRLVKEKAGPVFFLKPGAHLAEGDIEFAASLFGARPFFFVDEASDQRGTLQTAVQRLRDKQHPAMFVLANVSTNGDKLVTSRVAKNSVLTNSVNLRSIDCSIFSASTVP